MWVRSEAVRARLPVLRNWRRVAVGLVVGLLSMLGMMGWGGAKRKAQSAWRRAESGKRRALGVEREGLGDHEADQPEPSELWFNGLRG